jgi:hypothetical protein
VFERISDCGPRFFGAVDELVHAEVDLERRMLARFPAIEQAAKNRDGHRAAGLACEEQTHRSVR